MKAKLAAGVFALVGLGWAASLPAQFTLFPITPPNSVGPLGISLGPDGNVWFTALNLIGRITPSGTITTFELPTPDSRPRGIAAGPDGYLWFLEAGTRRVGRISVEGVITEYAIPAANSGPITIIAGPDGAMWFSDFLRDSVWRLTLSGGFTEFPVSTSAFGLTIGSDGNLWFNGFGGGFRIGRMTLAGAVTFFTRTSPPFTSVFSVGLGPDGNVWYGSSRAIGYITPSGAITEFPFAGDRGHIATAMAIGPDGNLWMPVDESFACLAIVPCPPPEESERDALLRVSTGAAQTRYPLSAEMLISDGSDITAGPGGSMWFTARRGIVRFFPSELPEPGLPVGVAVPAVGDAARVALVALLALVGFFLLRR